MDNFCFYQYEQSQIKNTQEQMLPSLLQDTALFETCLRKIYFFDEDAEIRTELLEKKIKFYQGSEALQRLLEVLCGLHSRVLGETEIFGQFKKFIDSIESSIESPEAQKIQSLQNRK